MVSCLSICSRSLVVSLADTAFSVLTTLALAAFLYTSGVTFWAANMFFGSASETNLSVTICGVVVKRSAAWTLPLFRSAMVIGPDSSSGENAVKVRPYPFFSPTMPSARVLNSDGPPMTQPFATEDRSEMDFRWYLVALAWVTVIESLSCAAEEFRISAVLGSLALRAAFTAAVLAALLVVSTDVVSSAPLYSGMIEIAPLVSSG